MEKGYFFLLHIIGLIRTFKVNRGGLGKPLYIGLAKKSIWSFPQNRKHIFIFTNNFIGYVQYVGFLPWYNVDCSQLMSRFDHYQLHLAYLTVERRPTRNLQHETSQTTFDTFDQSQHLLHTLYKSFFFLHFSCVFTFLEIIKHRMLKMCIFFHLQY